MDPATKLHTFQTNINCSSCVRTVTGFLDDVAGVKFWRVNVDDPRKVLSVEGTAGEEAIMKAVADAGFDIHPLSEA